MKQIDCGNNNSGARIIAASFGTTYRKSLALTIGAIEETIAEAFPSWELCRAFTSRIVIRRLRERDGLEADYIEQAMERAAKEGVARLIVQPFHLMKGHEYAGLAELVRKYESRFEGIALGEPLLSDERDLDEIVKILRQKTAGYDDGKTAVCFMGHGTDASANDVCQKLQKKFHGAGHEHYYIGTVEASPTLEDVLAALREKDCYQRVILEPLMVVAGDHACNDMAGDKPDSWKTALVSQGYEVVCLLEGLGQIPDIRRLYVEHVREAAALLITATD